jgi:hypothetical protein
VTFAPASHDRRWAGDVDAYFFFVGAFVAVLDGHDELPFEPLLREVLDVEGLSLAVLPPVVVDGLPVGDLHARHEICEKSASTIVELASVTVVVAGSSVIGMRLVTVTGMPSSRNVASCVASGWSR